MLEIYVVIVTASHIYKSWMVIPAKLSTNFVFWEEIHPNTPICDLYYSKEIISLL